MSLTLTLPARPNSSLLWQLDQRARELVRHPLPYAQTWYAPFQRSELTRVAASLSACSDVFILGIGGSDLGGRTIQRALSHRYANMLPSLRSGPKVWFAGDTTDPVPLSQLADLVTDWKAVGLVIVSKSGETIEPLANYLWLRAKLRQAGADLTKQVVAITDPSQGWLRQTAQHEGYQLLAIPPEVGGRYSITTAAGLFPMELMGHNTESFLQGAREVPMEAARDLAAFHLQHMAEGRGIHVVMPYRHQLDAWVKWYRQLWAESLGKNQAVNALPVAALGPTDQHSQVQRYHDGPDDATYTIVTVGSSGDLHVPTDVPSGDTPAALAGVGFGTLLRAEAHGTLQALKEVGRPVAHLHVPELTAYTLGQLVALYEHTTVLVAQQLGVDPFNQPGVQRGKELTWSELARLKHTDVP